MNVNEYDERPWGSWELLVNHGDWAVKILRIKPGGILSLQRHNKRSEQWTPLEPGLVAVVGDSSFAMRKGQSIHVPAGTVHRISNPTDKTIAVVEVITGEYDEHDIVRLHDIYDR